MVNQTFYDAVSMIYDIIIIANPSPYIAKLMVVLEIIKLNKSDVER